MQAILHANHHQGAQAPIVLPAPGVDDRSPRERMLAEGRARNPMPPTARYLQRAGRHWAAQTFISKSTALPPPGVPRGHLDGLVDVTAGIIPHQLAPSTGNRQPELPVGAAYPTAVSMPAPPRGNTFRRRPNPYNVAHYVNVVPAQQGGLG